MPRARCHAAPWPVAAQLCMPAPLDLLCLTHAELEQHAFSLDQQAEAFAEQALLSKRGQGPRNVPAVRH